MGSQSFSISLKKPPLSVLMLCDISQILTSCLCSPGESSESNIVHRTLCQYLPYSYAGFTISLFSFLSLCIQILVFRHSDDSFNMNMHILFFILISFLVFIPMLSRDLLYIFFSVESFEKCEEMKLSAFLQVEIAVDPTSQRVFPHSTLPLFPAFISAILNCSHHHNPSKCYLFS